MAFVSRARDVDRADRALVVLSDIEMGPGGETDDFPDTAWLARLILSYDRGTWARLPVQLVLNGDTFDLLKTPVDGAFPHLIDEATALRKMRAVVAAHPRFFEGLRRFLRHPGAERSVVFTIGNHDFELLFPAVQDAIRDAIDGTRDNVLFPGFSWDVGDVHLEHGSQADPLFRVDPEVPFVDWERRPILNLPWASVALLDVAMPLHRLLYACDRARPMARTMSLLPEIRSLLLDRYWSYWTRDWLSAWWSNSDPTKRVSWTLFRQVAMRLQSGDASVKLDPGPWPGVAEHHRLVVSGHVHAPSWSQVGGRRVLQTGCVRDEFELGEDGVIGDLLPKVYAEILMKGGRVVRSHLVEVLADRDRAACMPASIRDIVGPVQAMRDQEARTAEAQAEQLAAERRRG